MSYWKRRHPHHGDCCRRHHECCPPLFGCKPCCKRRKPHKPQKKTLECCEVKKSCGRVVLVCKEKGCNRFFEKDGHEFRDYEISEHQTNDYSEEEGN